MLTELEALGILLIKDLKTVNWISWILSFKVGFLTSMEVSRHDVVAQLEQKLKDETWNRVALYDISCHEEQARSAKYKWALSVWLFYSG